MLKAHTQLSDPGLLGIFSSMVTIFDMRRIVFHEAIISALPLNKRGNLHKAQLVSKIHELLSRQWLRQDISCLLISGDVLEPYCSPLYHVMNML